ncbi:MAG: hypothetical protein K2N21_06335 [Rikenellaceae bacterium]|nr:hypothetical protein [Rikenellaceae bacterium]
MKKSVKNLLQIVLLVIVCLLAYAVYMQIKNPLDFQEIKKVRDEAVISRLKDIRTAERAYKQLYSKYTGSFDTLINFIKTDSMVYLIKTGSEDDSLAVAKGLVKTVKVKIAVLDTIFNKGFNADDIRYIPFSGNTEFILAADTLTTGSKVTIPVFEAKAPFKTYLSDEKYHQELVNLIDKQKTLGKYPGMKVGSITEATNDAGNWE